MRAAFSRMGKKAFCEKALSMRSLFQEPIALMYRGVGAHGSPKTRTCL